MNWFRLLFSTGDFRIPSACGGWSPFLVALNISANLLIFLVYTTIPVLLVLFRFRKDSPTFFRESQIAMWFALFIFACGLTHLTRAAAFVWPAYRLFTLVALATALLSWITLAIMIPLSLEAQRRHVREERHAFADRMNTQGLQAHTRLLAMERVAGQMADREQELTAVLRELETVVQDLKGPGASTS